MKHDIRDQIIKATIDLLEEQNDADAITVRQIAEKAGVGLGLINYHFQTRDFLINEAIGAMMLQATQPYLSFPLDSKLEPAEALKQLFKATSEIGSRYSLGRFVVQYAMLQGNMETSTMIVPILRQYFGMQKTELEIRLMALCMVTALQIAYIRNDAFQNLTGMDIQNEQQRNKVVDVIVDQFLTKEKE